MTPEFILFAATLLFCYIYAFVGGFTDAANAIATSIGSRSLSPLTAVLMAGILETVGALTGTAVALTIGKGIVALELITLSTVLAALIGAMVWSICTYFYGIPVSETHGLIGAILGAGIAVGGTEVIIWSGIIKTLIAIVVSPLIGVCAGMLLMGIIYKLFSEKSAYTMNKLFKNLQRGSSALMAFSHGQNDAQKPMGVLVMTLALHYGWKNFEVPLWVILSVGFAAGLGVIYGGWRIVKTLGMRITPLAVEQGFAAETAAAGALQLASYFGIPVSTTHTITSAIVGSGAAKRISSVRWGIALDIVLSWIATLPATIALGWFFAKLLQLILI